LRRLRTQDPACFAGKLLGLFDRRSQRWAQLEWRKDVHETCRVDRLDFLQGLAAGRVLLFDLGYFSFPFFETLTDRKLWWVSRDRENTSYALAHVLSRHHEKLDALIWPGTGKKQARHLMRLVRLGDGIGVRVYLTTIGDPQMLSLGEVAQLYARRWESEMAFRLLKESLGMSHWWRRKQERILVQIWVVLILSPLVDARRERIALAVDCAFEVSIPILVDLLPQVCSLSPLQLEPLIQEGHHVGCCARARVSNCMDPKEISRAANQHHRICPDNDQDALRHLRVHARRNQPNGFVAMRDSARGDKHPRKPRKRALFKRKRLGSLNRQRTSPDLLFMEFISVAGGT